jgi:hypothetical protein
MAGGPMILGGNSNIGGIDSAMDTILGAANNAVQNQTFTKIADAYSSQADGVVDGPASSAYSFKGTASLFNPFYVYRYSKYGTNDGKNYSPEYHKNSGKLNILGNSALGKISTDLINNHKKEVIENPTAGAIIRWAQESADKNLGGSTIAPIPYQWNDFLWCKWYGKIPNNRLLTLRRYPIPVEDNIQIATDKSPLIPIAQAITWWGGDTGNTLNGVLGMEYGFNWKSISSENQDVVGNEVDADSVLDAAGLTQGNNENLRKALKALIFSDPERQFASSGFDKTAQDWLKDSYGNEGPYWNRVRGPVNVINSTQMRERGYDFNHNVKLKFSYKLRSFGAVNPKIAMLDLIANFLSLTYNKAEFWGGSLRYFQKTGYIIPGIPTRKFEEGDFIGGIQETISFISTQIQEKAGKLKELLTKMPTKKNNGEAFSDTDYGEFFDNLKNTPAVQDIAGSWVKDLMQKPLLIRSFLDGRAVGEWHLTVGNPMDPVAVIGNLCLKSTNISFSEGLGIDDFPTEVNFEVTLTPGRPRAKQDIESMFNLGAGEMYSSYLRQPSSAYNSFGEWNSASANSFRNNLPIESETSSAFTDSQFQKSQSGAFVQDSVNLNPIGTSGKLPPFTENTLNFYRSSVARAYGEKFSNSGALPEYFKQINTKD